MPSSAVYCTGISTLPGSSALGMVSVRTPSSSFADTPVLSTRLGSHTVRVKDEVPTNDLSAEIWLGSPWGDVVSDCVAKRCVSSVYAEIHVS